jgi:hypothetical protein
MVENIDHNVNRNICIFNTFCVNVNLLSIQPRWTFKMLISLAKLLNEGLFYNKLERFSMANKIMHILLNNLAHNVSRSQ